MPFFFHIVGGVRLPIPIIPGGAVIQNATPSNVLTTEANDSLSTESGLPLTTE